MIYQDLELVKGDTWVHQFDMLPELAGWLAIWFTAREERDALDATSLLQALVSNPAVPASDGLQYLNAAVAATIGHATLSVASVGPPGRVDFTVEADATSVLNSEKTLVFYDLQVDIAGVITTVQRGLLRVPHDATRAID